MKRFTTLLFILMGCLASPLTAQQHDTIVVPKLDAEAKALLAELDSLTNELFSDNIKFDPADTAGVNKYGFEPDFVPEYKDSFITAMMAEIPSEIDLVLNPYVKRYIEVYNVERRKHAQQILGLSQYYFPIFEEELEKHHMPHELKYLAIVESALNPNAVSRVGATGMWQIMYPTGRMLDLEINSYVDERRDPYESTCAAFDYLNRMHKVYGDWLLVIAAYNCGPGNVNKAIRRSGGKKDFWEIRNYLPRETRGYVPAFIAATLIFSHPEEFNLRAQLPDLDFNAVDTIHIYKEVPLVDIAEAVEMDLELLSLLNPSLKKQVIPALKNGYALKLPINKITLFEDKKQTILDAIPTPMEELLARSASTGPPNPANGYKGYTRLDYVVRSGDNLGYISDWYDVSISNIRQWNGISGNTIKPGQTLHIYIAESDAADYADINKLSFAEKQAGHRSVKTAIKHVPDNTKQTVLNYTVKEGDNLGFIAEWFDCKAQDIRNWNGIYGNTIKVGQKLNIYVPSSNADKYKQLDQLSFNKKQNLAFGRTQVKSTGEVSEEECQCVYYEVKPGDTLWEISKKYPGVSVDEIKQYNKIGNNISPGQKLRIQI